MSTPANLSYVSNTTQNNWGYAKSSETSIIVGVTIACFIVVAIAICVCYCLNRKYKFCPQTFIRKKKKKETTFRSTLEHDKPPVIPNTLNPRSLPYRHWKKPRASITIPSKPYRSDQCTENICKQYSKRLGLNRAYFNFNHNKCFCSKCYSTAKPNSYVRANSKYTIPRGWTRFGLQIDRTFVESKQIFKQWCTTFYGLSKDKLESIINNRFIPFPNDHLLSGEIFTTHLSDKHHIYTSPSINYACLKHICPTDTTKINNEWYDIQIVLECKQNPTGIIKQQGYRHNVCHFISDNEIEWKTDQRSSVVPYGLLIRARKHRCSSECTHIHS